MSNSQIKTIEKYVRLQENLATYRVIQAGIQTGILERLGQGQKTSAQLASDLNLDPWRTELLCSALTETGLVERYDDDFALSAMARMVPLNEQMAFGWQHLESALTPTPNPAESLPPPPSAEAPTLHHWTQTPAALDAVEALDIGRSRRGFRILDLGCGPAVFSAAIAHRDPDCRIVLLDDEPRLAQARTTISGIGVDKQFEFVVGDYRDPPLANQEFDLILIAGLLHRFPAEQCTPWLQRIVRHLKPEGDLAILDWYYGQAKGSRTLVFFELELTVQMPQAKLHRPPVIRDWMLEAGLDNIQFAFLPSTPHIWGLILGQSQGKTFPAPRA